MGRILIGTSRFDYPHWRGGVFYPRGLPRGQQLRFYAARFATLELNYPFYHLPSWERFASWAQQTPADFRFAAKASRFISHIKRLERLRGFLRILPAAPPWVLEFRHPSWLVDPVLELLAASGAGFCIPVGGRLRVEAIAATGPLGYLRFHSGRGRDGRFTPAELSYWADEIAELAGRDRGRTICVYFNNDQRGYAPRNAEQLRELLEAG